MKGKRGFFLVVVGSLVYCHAILGVTSCNFPQVQLVREVSYFYGSHLGR